jgi:hypothetical protein
LVRPWRADTGDTDATFTLAGGSLDVTAAASAALTDGSPGAASVSGSLGAVGVSDTRGSTAGWVVSAASTTFVDGAGSESTGVSYNSGAATASTGTVTPTSTGATSIAAVAPVAAGTLASGNNTRVRWGRPVCRGSDSRAWHQYQVAIPGGRVLAVSSRPNGLRSADRADRGMVGWLRPDSVSNKRQAVALMFPPGIVASYAVWMLPGSVVSLRL